MSAIEVVKTFVTNLQAGELEQAANAMADAFVERGLSPQPLDKRAFLALQSELNAALPDFSYNLENLQHHDNTVRGLVSIAGTHLGDLTLPMYHIDTPATSLTTRLPQVRVAFTLNDARQVVEMRVERVAGGGLAGLLQQIDGELQLLPRIDIVQKSQVGEDESW